MAGESWLGEGIGEAHISHSDSKPMLAHLVLVLVQPLLLRFANFLCVDCVLDCARVASLVEFVGAVNNVVLGVEI